MEETIYIGSNEGQILLRLRVEELKKDKERIEKEIKRRKAEYNKGVNSSSNSYHLWDGKLGLTKKLKSINEAIEFNYSLMMNTDEHEYQLEN